MGDLKEIAKFDKKLAFYIQHLKPYCDERLKSLGRLPTWEEIDARFPNELGKSKSRIWFINLLKKYKDKFINRKKNVHYNQEIYRPLREKYDLIALASNKGGKGCKKPLVMTKEQSEEIAKLL